MPGYMNPYYTPYSGAAMNYYGVGGYSMNPPANQSYAQPSMPALIPTCAAALVDGEIEARGRQIPPGVMLFYMFDMNSQTIYLKSVNQMGIPNPMQIMHYTIEEPTSNLPAGQSGSNAPDMSQYVSKQDFEQLKQEIRNMNKNTNVSGNQNGSNNGQNNVNRGGNR